MGDTVLTRMEIKEDIASQLYLRLILTELEGSPLHIVEAMMVALRLCGEDFEEVGGEKRM